MGVAMQQILEFPRGAIIFDPETIKIVAQAFDDAWDKIEKSGSGFARPAYANATREYLCRVEIEINPDQVLAEKSRWSRQSPTTYHHDDNGR